MEITSPYYKKKFESFFVDGNYTSKMNQYKYDPIIVEAKLCFCPNCNMVIYRSQISPDEKSELKLEECEVQTREDKL